MTFEWDATKSEKNLRERGFDFEYAAHIFDGPTIEQIDTRHDYAETRVMAFGHVGPDALMVVYTDRGPVRRIISARRSHRREQDHFKARTR